MTFQKVHLSKSLHFPKSNSKHFFLFSIQNIYNKKRFLFFQCYFKGIIDRLKN